MTQLTEQLAQYEYCLEATIETTENPAEGYPEKGWEQENDAGCR